MRQQLSALMNKFPTVSKETYLVFHHQPGFSRIIRLSLRYKHFLRITKRHTFHGVWSVESTATAKYNHEKAPTLYYFTTREFDGKPLIECLCQHAHTHAHMYALMYRLVINGPLETKILNLSTA